MRHLVTAIFFAALLFSLGEMGFLTEALNNLIAFTLVAAFIIMQRPRNLGRTGPGRLAAGGLLLVAAAIAAQGDETLRIVAFVVIPTALFVAIRDEEAKRLEMAVLISTVTFFLVFFIVLRHLPHVWWFTGTVALGFSKVTGRVIGQDYAFSATASGFRVLVLVAAWGLSRLIFCRQRRHSDILIFLVLLALITFTVQVLLTPLAMLVQRFVPGLDLLLFNPQVLYLAAAMVPMAWYSGRTPLRRLVVLQVRRLKLVPLVLGAGLILGLGLTLSARSGEGGGRILVLDEGFLNWETPVFGRYGQHSGGMFGRLPGLLEAQGYEVIKVPQPLDSDALTGSQALVIINLMEFLGPGERQAIWDFVAAGGRLLILGEHTGVKGIRGPFNDILGPVNIEFEFDSATFWGRGWHDAFELFPHPINRGVDVAEDIQIWIGASLGIGPPARPVIVGKYGYADIGDAASVERGYLGDRRHNPNELLGDLSLVAEASYGDGTVLVFGDTSPFQNLALVSSWAFVGRVFQYLTSPPSSSPSAIRAGLVIGAAVLVLLSWKLLAGSPYSWSVLTLGLAIGLGVTDRLASLPAPPEIDLPKALIDLSHGERFDQLTWYDDCVGGLELNLMRNGYCPLLTREFSGSLLRDSELLVVIAPSKTFSKHELEAIQAFLESGGILIVSTGYEEKDHSEPLLELFGVSIQNIPLAHFEVEVMGETVRFAEAWPLEVSQEAVVPVCHHPGFPDPVMVFAPMGRGGALVIGDSRFLLNSNLESLNEWRIGNIMFLKHVLERVRSGGFGP